MRFCGDCGTPLRQLEGTAHSTSSYADLERFLTEARDQQTATAEILRVIGTSPTDAHPVFEAIACSGVQVCGALSCGVFVVDGEMLHLAATHGVPAARIERFRSQFPAPLTSPEDATRAVRDRSIFHMADIENNPAATPGQIEVARLGGYCTRLMVPMLRGDNALGLIAVTSAAPTPFPERQVELLKTFADQAVIAIENVRLFKELQEKNYALTEAHAQVSEALEQQTATSDILRVISSSPTDLQPVMAAVAENAARLCNANDAQIFRADGDILLRVGSFGSMLVADQFPLGRANPPGRAIVDRQVIHVNDIAAEVDTEFPDTRYVQKRQGIRTVLAAPLLREGVPVGAIVIRRLEVQPFSDKQVALLQTFADQAVIAIENVRLFKELQASNRDLTEALEQQTATSEILRVISSSPTDVQPVFDVIVEQACRLCDAVVANAVRIDGDLMHNMAAFGFTPEAQAVVRRSFPMRPSRATMSGRAILARAVVAYEDASIDEVGMTSQEISRSLGGRAMVSVPMLRDGIAVGAITLARRERGRFPERQVNLLRSFAHQAVIALENVRLFKELEARNHDLTESLEQQTATAEILRIISQSRTDVQPVFDAIATSAMRLCGGDFASVFRVEGDRLEPMQTPMTPEHSAFLRRYYPRPIDATSLVGRSVVERRVVHVPDLADPSAPARVTQESGDLMRRSQLTVPMLRSGEPVGVIAVSRRQPGAFSETQVELLKTFADQAVIAIENARLLSELQARTQELTRSVGELQALGEVGQAISSTLDLETVLTTIVSRAVQLSGLDGGVVFEYDEAAEEFVQRVATETGGGALAEARRCTRIRKGEGVLGRTAITLEPVQVADITVPGAHESRLRENLIESGIRAVLAVPMVREGRLIGCLGVTRSRPGAFPAETIELLRTFATQSALAIQNARLFQEIADKSRQLEAASRHKSEFLANMSHELRTPLNAVIGFSEVLIQRMFGALNDKQDEYLKDIYASGQHLLSLINDILDLSKIEAGRMELAPAPFHLPIALENAVTLVRERAARHGITLELDLDPRLGELVGDERKVKQVVLNLLSNAVKFTPDGGRITLKAGRRDGRAEISVADTGIGIAPEDQAAIFEEFRQVGTDETRKQEGTGLGLTLAKKFVELHGGRIWVESEPGRGSTFTFTLPVS